MISLHDQNLYNRRMGRPDNTGTPRDGRPSNGLPPPQPTEPPPADAPQERQPSLFDRYKVWFIAAGLVILVAAMGVNSLVGGDDDTPSNPGSSTTGLLPAHRDMVDTLAAEGDCASLQARFDDAADNRGTPGSDLAARNLALMEYADDAMRRIGCY